MKTNTLKHSITVTTATQRTKIKIRLSDDCRNGHEDFSITADVDEKDARGIWRERMCGCCHEHILTLRPDLKPFVDLHLSAWQGVPMHAMADAWYWFAGIFPDNLGEKYTGATGSSRKSPDECHRIFVEHLRITPQEAHALIDASPRTKEELHALLEDMSLPARWQSEAAAAIRQLEEWTGNTFESKATRGFWEPLPQDVREEIKALRASGYYDPAQADAGEEVDDAVFALCQELDVEPSEIDEESHTCYGLTVYSVGRAEYAVGTDEEADEAWDQALDSYLDDCGVLDALHQNLRRYFDRDAWKKDARYDGRGHFLASYDGDELDLPDGYVAFRIN
jgi:hypothetical protein